MVTGLYIPCINLVHAAKLATEYQIGGNVLKVGKNQGQWYCEVIYNRGV